MMQPQTPQSPAPQTEDDPVGGLLITGAVFGAAIAVIGFVAASPFGIIGVLVIAGAIFGWVRHQETKKKAIKAARKHEVTIIRTSGEATALPTYYTTTAQTEAEREKTKRDTGLSRELTRRETKKAKEQRNLAGVTLLYELQMETIRQAAETERARIAADSQRWQREEENRWAQEIERLKSDLKQEEKAQTLPYETQQKLWEVFGNLTKFQEDIRDKAIRFPSQRDRLNTYLESMNELRVMLQEGVKSLQQGGLDEKSIETLTEEMLKKMGSLNEQYLADMRRG